MRGWHCGPCSTAVRHGWCVLRMVMSGRKICHALIPILDWLFPRGYLRPRGRRNLYAFRARLVDEPLRVAILRAREQVIQMGGDGPKGPCVLSDRMALSGPCKNLFPICSESHGSSGTWWPSLKGHFVALIGSGTRQVSNELRKQEITARMWTRDELAEPSAFRSLARECKHGLLRASFCGSARFMRVCGFASV